MNMETQPKRIIFDDLVKINKVHIRGLWDWTIQNSNCAICRNQMHEQSPNQNYCNEIYAVVGKCGHAFHYDCISNWTRTRNVCPLCNQKWEPTSNY